MTSKTETKQAAVQEIHLLMERYGITLEDLDSTRSAIRLPERNIAKQFLAYIGGIFILAGISIYITQHWSEFNIFAKLIITLGVGLALFIFALVASNEEQYQKITTPFFILAALFQTIGMYVALTQLFHYTTWEVVAMLVFGTLLVQQLLTFAKYNKTSLLFLSILFGLAFFQAVFSYLQASDEVMEITFGLSICLICYAIHDSRHRMITPFWYLIGSGLFLIGFFSLLEDTQFEILYVAVCVLVIYLSTILKSRTILFSGTVSLLSYIGYFTTKYFSVSLGWPLSLIIFGLLLVAISVISIRLGKQFK